MSGNRPRDTAGRTLIGFTLLVGLVVGVSLRDWWGRADLEWARLPTAVEDQHYYEAIGDDDFSEPNLVFWAAPGGLVRQDPEPRLLRDFRMRKLVDPRTGQFTRCQLETDPATGLPKTGHFVYWYDKEGLDPFTRLPPRVYLKVADDRYVLFGPPVAEAGEAEAGAEVGADSGLRQGGAAATPSARS